MGLRKRGYGVEGEKMSVAGLICLFIFSVPLTVAAEPEDGIQQVLLRLSPFQETFQQDPPGVLIPQGICARNALF